MDTLDAMKRRHSTRAYTGEALTAAERATVEALVAEAVAGETQVSMQFAAADGTAFDARFDKVSYYGRFKDVPACVILASPATPEGLRATGHAGETLVLALTGHGLDTCWAGGVIETADRTIGAESEEFDAFVEHSAEPVDVDALTDAAARFHIAITLGHALRPGHPHRSKPIADLLADGTDPDALPDWFAAGMEGVQLAPSALNRQNVRFAPTAGPAETHTVRVTDVGGLLAKVNTGVAMLHFEQAAGVPVEFVLD
ncbi:nitroreductase family protein [Bifidobacterium cuniculi]|uniref:Nitroreductase family protein n=1 Tax=Bifidobacterium cuniculi TaxID=1688 RepID=A0A087B2M4_9BIFI|nr:nitroreductase family protein [Bifidobacterium cuniculi]KFI65274.1 nitroreductase family protein [Bifidobacterium cuniculi]